MSIHTHDLVFPVLSASGSSDSPEVVQYCTPAFGEHMSRAQYEFQQLTQSRILLAMSPKRSLETLNLSSQRSEEEARVYRFSDDTSSRLSGRYLLASDVKQAIYGTNENDGNGVFPCDLQPDSSDQPKQTEHRLGRRIRHHSCRQAELKAILM